MKLFQTIEGVFVNLVMFIIRILTTQPFHLLGVSRPYRHQTENLGTFGVAGHALQRPLCHDRRRSRASNPVTSELCHAETSLNIFVGVILKEGLAGTSPAKASFSFGMTPITYRYKM